jgi:hypothetical protein
VQSATGRKIPSLLFIVLLAAAAGSAAPVVADEDQISSPIGTVSNTAMSNDEAWAIRISEAASSATDPGSTTVSDPIPSVSTTVSDPIPSVSDTVSDPIPSVSDTVSDATGAVSDTVSDATGAVSGTASGATGRASDHGLGVGASTRGNTPAREGQGVPCDAQTNTCIPDAAEGGSLAGAMERILDFLALTGWGVLPWIVIAVGLTALGIFLLRSSRRRTSRTGPAKSTSAAAGRKDAGPVRSGAQPPASG